MMQFLMSRLQPFSIGSKLPVLLLGSRDRLSRGAVLPTLQYLQRLTSYGVGYRSFTEQYFDFCGRL
jgi:DNA invertase Pin-like site-specific DNA recombinase